MVFLKSLRELCYSLQFRNEDMRLREVKQCVQDHNVHDFGFCVRTPACPILNTVLVPSAHADPQKTLAHVVKSRTPISSHKFCPNTFFLTCLDPEK